MLGRIGMPELLLALGVALIVFGPGKLPEIGKSFGRGIREFKDATNDLSKSIVEATEEKEA
jgi:sec-independent protein translocase protein TatA